MEEKEDARDSGGRLEEEAQDGVVGLEEEEEEARDGGVGLMEEEAWGRTTRRRRRCGMAAAGRRRRRRRRGVGQCIVVRVGGT